jgi:hypothetical protein
MNLACGSNRHRAMTAGVMEVERWPSIVTVVVQQNNRMRHKPCRSVAMHMQLVLSEATETAQRSQVTGGIWNAWLLLEQHILEPLPGG